MTNADAAHICHAGEEGVEVDMLFVLGGSR
jgi:hypothetical protein